MLAPPSRTTPSTAPTACCCGCGWRSPTAAPSPPATRCCGAPPKPVPRAAASAKRPRLSGSSPRPSGYLGVGEAELATLGKIVDLFEAFAEIEFERFPFGPAEMRCAQRVGHLEKRMVATSDRLLIVDVDSGIARSA